MSKKSEAKLNSDDKETKGILSMKMLVKVLAAYGIIALIVIILLIVVIVKKDGYLATGADSLFTDNENELIDNGQNLQNQDTVLAENDNSKLSKVWPDIKGLPASELNIFGEKVAEIDGRIPVYENGFYSDLNFDEHVENIKQSYGLENIVDIEKQSDSSYFEKIEVKMDTKRFQLGTDFKELLFVNSNGLTLSTDKTGCVINNSYLECNLAKNISVNQDLTIYTIALREGLHWSDGEEFTADDCVFWYENLYLPGYIDSTKYASFLTTVDGERVAARIVKKDKHTIAIIFQGPKAHFIQEVIDEGLLLYAPSLYYKQLLPEFIGEEAADLIAKSNGYRVMPDMIRDILSKEHINDVPTMSAYIFEKKLPGREEIYQYTNNPYYFKISKDGYQLSVSKMLQVDVIK